MAIHPVNVLSIASGAGGLDLGVELGVSLRRLEQAVAQEDVDEGGVAGPSSTQPVCYVEIELQAASILAARIEEARLPAAPIWSNLKSFDPRPWRGLVDLLIGGYPCQPFSVAGKQRGFDDPRNLWPAIRDTIEVVGPCAVFFENVSNHLRQGFDTVAGDLLDLGYDVAATLLTASEVGAPHKRERLFILGVVNTEREGLEGTTGGRSHSTGRARGESAEGRSAVDHPDGGGRDGRTDPALSSETEGRRGPEPASGRVPVWPPGPEDDWAGISSRYWPVEFAVRGVADGAAGPVDLSRADRIRILGNGVVPQQAASAFVELASVLGYNP